MTMIVMLDPMLCLYALAYKHSGSVSAEPLSEETTNIIADYISGCCNIISLDELEELAEEEEDA